jgi:RHS repeat-associated protein
LAIFTKSLQANLRANLTFSDGTFTQETYDSAGQLTAKTDQNGYKTSYEYDAQGRLKAVIDALNNRTEYSYDISGNLLSVKDANNRITSNEYDALNRRVTTILPLGQRSTMTYDPVGNMSSLTNFNGEVINYEYDKLNRLSKKILPDETFTMTYTAIGKMASVTDSRGTTTYSYDVRQRLTEQKEPDGKFLRYGYDGVGNRTILTTTSGTTTFTYDKYNQLATVSDPTGNITTYTYDKAGNLTQTIMPNSVLETRSYDTLNRLTKIESKKDSTVLFSAAYTLDNAGMRTRVVETGRTVDYTYDKDYRLLSENDGVSTNAYTYDPTGNRLTKTDALGTATYIYDANDRLLTDGTTTYSYDANGNKKTETKAGVTTTYTWDAESRLKGSQSGNTNTVYDYDLGGIRVSQSVNGVETKYLVDKNRNYAQVIEEYNSLGVQASYIYGNDLISQSRNGVDSFYGYDGLGSTRVLTDEVGGVTDKYTYDAYGRILKSTGTTQNNYLYAGEQFDRGLNQYYLRDRYYGNDIGRFTQRDRFEGDMMNPLSLNKYGYTHGNPVNVIDPTGMFSIAQSLVAIQGFSTLLAQQLVLFSMRSIAVGGTLGGSGLSVSGRVALIVGIALFAATALHSDEAENTGIPAIIWGLEMGQTTIHNYKALHGEGNTSDRYEGRPIQPIFPVFKKRSRQVWKYADFPPCKTNGIKGDKLTCDEFPYATTEEGGLTKYKQGKVSLALVPEAEQSGVGQGNRLKAFYNLAKLNNGEKYGVWATYKSWNTAYFTKDRREGVRFLPPFPLYVASGLKQKDFENEYAKNNI